MKSEIDELRELDEAAERTQREIEELREQAGKSEPPRSRRFNGGFRTGLLVAAAAVTGGGSAAVVNSIWSDPAIRDRLELVRVHETRIDVLEKRVERCEARWRDR